MSLQKIVYTVHRSGLDLQLRDLCCELQGNRNDLDALLVIALLHGVHRNHN